MTILNTIKQIIGIDPSVEDFDDVIMVNINNTIIYLWQIGVLKDTAVFAKDAEWNNFKERLFVSEDLVDSLKMYIALRVKQAFDPAQSSTVQEANKSVMQELEWRLMTEAEGGQNGS